MLLIRERVLVVARDSPTLEATVSLVRRSGYRCETAASGGEALRALADDPLRFAVVLADVSLPDLDAETLVAGIACRAPGLPVVVAGASSASPVPGARGFVRKPLRLEAVQQALDDVTGRRD